MIYSFLFYFRIASIVAIFCLNQPNRFTDFDDILLLSLVMVNLLFEQFSTSKFNWIQNLILTICLNLALIYIIYSKHYLSIFLEIEVIFLLALKFLFIYLNNTYFNTKSQQVCDQVFRGIWAFFLFLFLSELILNSTANSKGPLTEMGYYLVGIAVFINTSFQVFRESK